MRVVVYVIVTLIVVGMIVAMVGSALAAQVGAAAPAGGGRAAADPALSAAPAAPAAPGTPGAPAQSAGPIRSPAPVVVLATTGLSWADIAEIADAQETAGAVPADQATARILLSLAARAEPANLVQRTVGDVTCPADAWLALGAGARTSAVGPPEGGQCAWPPSWQQALDASHEAGYAASPGALADALSRAGLEATAIGPGAELALTRPDGGAPATADSLADLVPEGLPALTVVDGTRSGADPAGGLLEDLKALTDAPGGVRVIVASLADPADPGPQMLLLPAGTTGWGDGGDLIAGPSTHQAGYVQLTDLAPTILRALGAHAPSAMTGRALVLPATGGPAPAASASGQNPRVGALIDSSLRARASRMTTLPVSLLIAGAALVLLVTASVSLRGPAGRRRLHGVGVAATAVGALPLGAWVAVAIPWWRLGADGDAPSRACVPAAMGATVLFAVVLVGALHGLNRIVIHLRDRLLVAARNRGERAGRDGHAGHGGEYGESAGHDGHGGGRGGRDESGGRAGHDRRPAAVRVLNLRGLRLPSSSQMPTVLSLTALLLSLCIAILILTDAADGAAMAFNGTLGMDAVVAGRFYGMSNTAFALAAAALVVAAAAWTGPVVEAQATRRERRTAAIVGVAVVGVPALVVDGLPQLGADVGGALTLVAALVALGTALAGGRIGWKQWLGVAVVATATAGVFGLVDYALGSRTHMGRFIGQLQDGTAATTIRRKLLALVNPFFSSPLAATALFVGLAVIGAGAWWWRREARAWRAGLSGYATLTQPEVQEPGGAAARPRPAGDDAIPSGYETRPRPAEGPVDAPSAGAAGEPWVGPVPGGRSLVPQWFVPALKALGVLIVVEVLVNDSGASMAVLSAACAAPLLLALAAARLQASVR